VEIIYAFIKKGEIDVEIAKEVSFVNMKNEKIIVKYVMEGICVNLLGVKR